LPCCFSEVFADSVRLSDGTVVPCGLVVWSTGLSPRPFTRNLKVAKNERGQILTDNHLQVRPALVTFTSR